MLGKLNFGALMKGAQKIQEMIEKNQEELANTEVTGESGAGLVKVTLSGLYVVKKLELADELLAETKNVMEELIAAAMTNATQKLAKVTQNKMSDMAQLFGGGLGGGDITE
jgi:nucleoid-associated protein EbfC